MGTTAGEGTDGAPLPLLFAAVTVHVYVSPLDKPATTMGDAAPVAEPGAPPFDDAHAAVYPVMGLPPLNGATNDTVNSPLPTPAVGCPGAFGTVLGITGADAGDGGLVPFAFVAVTVHEYDFPFDRDPTEIGEVTAEFEPATPPFDELHEASKRMIMLPPSAGATNDTVNCPFPTPAVGCAGAAGIVLGTTGADAGDGALVPFAFVAVTVHVYVFPFVNDPTTTGEPGPDADPAAPPFDDTHAAPKLVMALPPSNGTTNETETCAFPNPTVGCTSTDGIVLGIAFAEAGDGALVPLAFVAVTVHVYDFPFDRPPMTIGEPAAEFVPAVPPFDDTHAAVKLVMPLPPSNGATNETPSCALPATTVGCAGAVGTVLGITTADADEGAPLPLLFVAVTVHVYDFPLDTPPTTIGDAKPVFDPAVPPFADTQAAS